MSRSQIYSVTILLNDEHTLNEDLGKLVPLPEGYRFVSLLQSMPVGVELLSAVPSSRQARIHDNSINGSPFGGLDNKIDHVMVTVRIIDPEETPPRIGLAFLIEEGEPPESDGWDYQIEEIPTG